MKNLFGWVAPKDRTDEQKEAHDKAILSMPEFKVFGDKPIKAESEEDQSLLYLFEQKVNNGQNFDALYQEEGSCVMQGALNVVWTLSAVEKVRLGDPDAVKMPFMFLAYARSRKLAGIRGNGSGSFGSTMAKAVTQGLILPSDMEGLPKYKRSYGITWGSAVELGWSDENDIPKKWFEAATPFAIKTTAQIKTTKDLRDALRNGYPATCASDWGGLMQCPVKEGVLLNRHSGVWRHQVMVKAYRLHPVLGYIYFLMNSWGAKAHGKCPIGPEGGFWIQEKDMQYIIAQDEVFAFSNFDGFPGQDLNEMLFKVFGS